MDAFRFVPRSFASAISGSEYGPVMVLKFKERNTLLVFYFSFFVVRDTVAEANVFKEWRLEM